MTGALLTAGVMRGDAVAILGGRSLDAICGFFAAIFAGGMPCLPEPRLPPAQISARLAFARARWLVVGDGFSPPPGSAARPLALADLSNGRPATGPELGPDDDALLLFTSGSTGASKAVLLSHRNLIANADGIADRTAITPKDRLLHVMPLHHTNGINNQIIAPLLHGAAVTLSDQFRAESFFPELAAARPTYFTGVPTMFSRLLDHSPSKDALAALRFARCGSAPITEAMHRRIEVHLGVPLVVSYGLSEATCTSTMNPPAARRVGTVGTALMGQEVAVLPRDSTIPLGAGSDGEVAIRGPAVMKGYLDDAEDNAESARILDGDWIRTGDLGRFDSDGYLAIVGRIKEIILRGGENIAPQPIEKVLLAEAGVKACCVVGAPHADLGEVPVAFVVADGEGITNAAMLKAAVAAKLSRKHVPDRIVVLRELPENAAGKIDRKALKALAADLG